MSQPRAARIITVLNLKGGVGKTHTVWLLGAVAQERGRRTLLIDTDSQGNLTSSFLAEPDGRPGIERLFDPGTEPDAAPLIRRTRFEHLDLLPAFPTLGKFDVSKQEEWEASGLHFSLRDALRPLRSAYDLIVIDCPPRLSLVSMAALSAADGLVIPLEAADWGAQGVAQVTEAFKYVRSRYNPKLVLLGYLASRFKRTRSLQRGYHQQLRNHYRDLAFDTVIPDLSAFEKSVTHRIPITVSDPRGPTAAIARQLFDEVLARSDRSREGRDEPRGTLVRNDAVPGVI